MSHFNFEIPTKRDELQTENDGYYVKSITGPRELLQSLKVARLSHTDEGAEFILEHFDLYYSVVHQADSINIDLVHKAYQDLHKAIGGLKDAIAFLLEDKSSITDEIKQKYQNIVKMLVYIYIELVLYMEYKTLMDSKKQDILKGKKKNAKSTPYFNLDRKNIVLSLNNIIQTDISVFWDPPVVEENFLNLISEVCYKFLQNPSIKSDKEAREQIFNIFGTLIKTYHLSTSFAIRMTQMVKTEEHMAVCLSEGIQQLVNNFNCKGLIHALIKEITEWQSDEQYQDTQGSKHCAQLLTSMAVLMPDLMIPEILYLNKYLDHESPNLRNSVLNVITEVLINVLMKVDIAENERDEDEEKAESRNDFLHILLEHINDVSAHVRTKVIQNWARLQDEGAVPLTMINQVLEACIEHLFDKSALVRKSAASCVTTFLNTNPYRAELSLIKIKGLLEKHQSQLFLMKIKVDEMQMAKIEELGKEWNTFLPELEKVIQNVEENDSGSDEDTENEKVPSEKQICEMIRLYLKEKKFKDAYILCKRAASEYEDFEKYLEMSESNTEGMLLMLKAIYLNPAELLQKLKENLVSLGQLTEEDIQKYKVLQDKVESLERLVKFLTLIDSAIDMMIELLDTVCISDMQEAINFFIMVYKFQIDNSDRCIQAMLQIMQRNEQDRKDMIVDAFKTIYLKTSSSNMFEHCNTVVRRLIGFMKSIKSKNFRDFELIISSWVSKGVLDNSVIDMLWQYFIKKVDVSDEDSHASCELLRMAALSRQTIIARNVKLVTSITFGERGEKNMAFFGSACKLLSVLGRDRIEVTSADAPYKIPVDDDLFKDLFQILLNNFFEPVEFYHEALSRGLEFVFQVCSKPEVPCEEFVLAIFKKLNEDKAEAIDTFVYIRLCQLLGLLAINVLDYLDETVYKELKRREHVRSERQNNKKDKSKKKVRQSHNSTATTAATDSSVLEGAQAEDEDAEFILRVLEYDTVTSSSGIGQLVYIVKNICTRPQDNDNGILQGVAVVALIRCMLVSSRFCGENIQLLFTIFEKTQYTDIKASILVHMSDLLTRFPNVIEPWTPKICDRLNDPSLEIRSATFFTLSNLILKDMIRSHSYIPRMAICLIEENKQLNDMCRTFFVTLSHKENLYNVLPDIFSHLMTADAVSEEQIKDIMKFLFGLIDKTKYMESLVDRFCIKFDTTEDIVHHRHIAYCLSLITYNDKALKKLQENFYMYKNLVHDAEIYGYFKNILQECKKTPQVGKADLKPIVAEIEKSINSVFELNQDGNLMKPPPVPPKKSTRTKSKSSRSTRKRSKTNDSDEEEENISIRSSSNNATPARKSARTRKVHKVMSDSDSD